MKTITVTLDAGAAMRLLNAVEDEGIGDAQAMDAIDAALREPVTSGPRVAGGAPPPPR